MEKIEIGYTLPKELIERKALIERLKRNLNACNPGTFSEMCFRDAINTVTNFPAADVVPAVHGRWKYDNSVNFWKCSHCGVNAPLQGKFMQLKTKYCPSYGAKMDLEGGSADVVQKPVGAEPI